jgi:hypothetical protein
MLAARTTAVSSSPMNRSATTNNPLRVRADGRTPGGRRVRDLYRGFFDAMGRPRDPTVQAGIIAAAELLTAAETARTELLAGRGDVEQVIRLENLSARAIKRLGIKPNAEPHKSAGAALDEYLARNHGTPEPAPT